MQTHNVMHRPLFRAKPVSAKHQTGVATIFIILMISLAMTAAAFGVVHSLKGNQTIQVAAHAQTRSQASAWAGVEVFRKYLTQASETPGALDDLDGAELSMSITGLTDTSLTAESITVTPPAAGSGDLYQVTANIRSTDTRAASSSVVQAVYQFEACSGDANLNATLDFHDDLDLGGHITINTDEGSVENVDLFVDGDITLGGISITGTGKAALFSTGNVTLTSAVSLPYAHANGNLTMEGSASVEVADVVGHIQTSGAARVSQTARANGFISHGGGNAGDLSSLSTVNISAGGTTISSINAASTVTLASAANIGKVESRGDVNITGQIGNIDEIESEFNVSCPSDTWSNFGSIVAEGTTSNCPDGNVTTGASVNVTNMSPVEAFGIEPVIIDAWPLKNDANYIFEPEDGEIRVTVRNVNTIPDGAYYLGTHPDTGHENYLCDTIASGTCSSTPLPSKICNGFSDQNACFTYDDSTATWTLNGTNMAPGAVWLQGDVFLGTGTYYNSFIATGDISTGGSLQVISINFAGTAFVCVPSAISANFSNLFPTNLCDETTGELIPESVGNVALLAGGYIPDPADPSRVIYDGGDINLGASNVVSGSVLAGDYLFSGGSTTVNGFVSASGLGGIRENVSNSLGASTTINLAGLPETYDPTLIPGGGDEQGGSCSGDGANGEAQTLWSRYL